MQKILIVTNQVKDPNLELTNRIEKYLTDKGVCVSCVIRNCDNEEDESKSLSNVDAAIVLGGDGSILQAAREMASNNIPILGVNVGTLGFLAETDPDGVENAIDRILDGDYELCKRMMLDGKVVTKDEVHVLPSALNDITISRCGSLQILKFGIYVNDKFLCEVSADGIIVATPTGSTGYNMSAGGPIVEPEADLILLTPICAHTLNSRSIVLSAKDKVEVVVGSGRDGKTLMVQANSDGSDRFSMYTGDKLVVKRSIDTTSIIKLSDYSFLQTLNKKLE